MALMPVSKVQTMIMENKRQARYDSLRIGDIVEILCGNNELGIVISKEYNKYITLLLLEGSSYYFQDILDVNVLVKLPLFAPTRGFTIKELAGEFEKRLEWTILPHAWQVDNLTYIEILGRLKEYERIQS